MLRDRIPPDVVAEVKGRLGVIYEELLVVMIDLATPPIRLFGDDRARLVDVRMRAVACIEDWYASEPSVVDGLVGRLPEVMRLNDAAASLLEAAPWADYFGTHDSAFQKPASGDRVFTKAPDLLDRVDDDGLLAVSGLDARPHGLLHSDLSIHYHQFLRRGFASSIHYELVGTVLGIARGDDVQVRLAIDGQRLRSRSEHEEIEERDYWYGPPLDDELLDGKYLVGETIHGDREGGQSILNPYIATSFRWTADDQLKTIEIEELVPVNNDESDLVLARYLHAIRDTSRQVFVHCDGAVKGYQRDRYPRTVNGFADRGRSDRYRKVFRLDGEIQTDDWSRVASLWFRGNQLVLEYLAGLGTGQPR
jgi:hypothetical protein